MIPSHKRLLLDGFFNEFGKLGEKHTDNVPVILEQGSSSAINAMVRVRYDPLTVKVFEKLLTSTVLLTAGLSGQSLISW